MWESTITGLSAFDVASDPELGITGVLESINTALTKYVPKEWGVEPHLRVSALTRDHLRNVITAFIATGEGEHSAPYYRQGAGTINMLILAMLSQIAEDRQNVIFAMEEPETAIPPYAQSALSMNCASCQPSRFSPPTLRTSWRNSILARRSCYPVAKAVWSRRHL